MGVLDVPLMLLGLYERTACSHARWRSCALPVPLWRDLLTRCGAVDGTRENCEALMRAGESVLVFPGVPRGLQTTRGAVPSDWKSRTGFAHWQSSTAIRSCRSRCGCEECYDILVDSDELGKPAGPVLEWSRPPDEVPPCAGIGPLRARAFLLRFERRSRRGDGRAGRDQRACLELRAEVQARSSTASNSAHGATPRPDAALAVRIGASLRADVWTPARRQAWRQTSGSESVAERGRRGRLVRRARQRSHARRMNDEVASGTRFRGLEVREPVQGGPVKIGARAYATPFAHHGAPAMPYTLPFTLGTRTPGGSRRWLRREVDGGDRWLSTACGCAVRGAESVPRLLREPPLFARRNGHEPGWHTMIVPARPSSPSRRAARARPAP